MYVFGAVVQLPLLLLLLLFVRLLWMAKYLWPSAVAEWLVNFAPASKMVAIFREIFQPRLCLRGVRVNHLMERMKSFPSRMPNAHADKKCWPMARAPVTIRSKWKPKFLVTFNIISCLSSIPRAARYIERSHCCVIEWRRRCFFSRVLPGRSISCSAIFHGRADMGPANTEEMVFLKNLPAVFFCSSSSVSLVAPTRLKLPPKRYHIDRCGNIMLWLEYIIKCISCGSTAN